MGIRLLLLRSFPCYKLKIAARLFISFLDAFLPFHRLRGYTLLSLDVCLGMSSFGCRKWVFPLNQIVVLDCKLLNYQSLEKAVLVFIVRSEEKLRLLSVAEQFIVS